MPLRLIVLRHAKSSWKSDAPSDHERPLNGRGKRDAPRIADHLNSIGWVPDQVFCSTSKRTRQTWSRMAAVFASDDIACSFQQNLYHAGPAEVRSALRDLDAASATAMVIGHNPGWETVVETLSGTPAVRMTTCNAALLRCELPSWKAAVAASHDGGWKLLEIVRPKELE